MHPLPFALIVTDRDLCAESSDTSALIAVFANAHAVLLASTHSPRDDASRTSVLGLCIADDEKTLRQLRKDVWRHKSLQALLARGGLRPGRAEARAATDAMRQALRSPGFLRSAGITLRMGWARIVDLSTP